MKETRFLNRKCYLIDFDGFEEIMREIYEDEAIKIERDYLVLSCYSSSKDCCYDEEEIMKKIGKHLNKNIIHCLPIYDLEYVYFIEG